MEQILKNREMVKIEGNCDSHGPYAGWAMEIAGQLVKSECPACAEEESKAAAQERCAAIAMAQAKAPAHAIPPRFHTCTIDTANWDGGAKAIKDLVTRYINNFKQVREKGTSLLFIGGTGTGKTHLATAIANSIASRGHSACYVNTLSYVSKVKRSWNPSEGLSEDAIIDDHVKYELLVIDELGKGNLDNKERSMLFRLIDRRYEEKKPTIGITNKTTAQLVAQIDEDTVRRLTAGGGLAVNFAWPPYNHQY